MPRSNVIGELVKEYLYKYPSASKKTIAEKLYKDNQLTFKDVEAARRVVRYYTGANGKRNHKQPIMRETNFSNTNPYGLPESDAVEFKPYTLPKANNNILFLSDIHLPYHDIQALTIALDYGKQHRVNTIYLNGDIMDFYKASFHEQDPKKRDLSHEFKVAGEFLDLLKREFPTAKIFWKEGNHCMRWQRYLRVKAPIVLDMDEFRLPVILKLRERGVTWIENKQLVKIGKLNAIHGNEYKGGGGINVARTLWLRAGDNVIAGDKHKTQNMIKTNVDKKTVGTWSVGCLCELNPDYMPFNEWNHGFAHITVENNGDFKVKNLLILDGKLM